MLTKEERLVLVKTFKWFGFGLLSHDFAHQVYQLKGFHNLVEGGYVGLAIFLVCHVLVQVID